MARTDNSLHLVRLASIVSMVVGLWFTDCVLIALGAYLVVHTFYLSMDAGAPWDGLRVAIRCWVVGSVLMLLGLLVVTGAIFKQISGWYFQEASLSGVAATFAVVGGLVVCSQIVLRNTSQIRWLFVVFLCALIARYLPDGNSVTVGCVYAIVVATGISITGWRLARHIAADAIISD